MRFKDLHYHLSSLILLASIILPLYLVGCSMPGPGRLIDHLSPLVPKPVGHWELFWTAVGEQQTYRLTAPPLEGRSLAWSPDGTKLTFISNRDGNDEVYVMNADGSAKLRLTYSPADEDDPEWAPDGTRIVFTSDRTGRWEVYTMRADGSEQRQVTQTAKGDSINPAWFPIISGGPCGSENRPPMPPGHSDVGPLRFADANPHMPHTRRGQAEPDPRLAQPLAKPEVCFGQALSYVSNKDGNWEIYLIAADGTHEQRLTHDPAMDGFCWNEWSPDGRFILFDTNRDGLYQVYRMDADGGHPQNLSSIRAPAEGPAWSPDGGRIAYTSRQDGNWEIYGVNADGTGLRRLTKNRAKDFNPFWSPDGTTIAFISDRDGHNEIYTMKTDGSSTTRLTSGMADKGRDRHRWSPDGSKIAYVAYTGRGGADRTSLSAARQRESFSPSDD